MMKHWKEYSEDSLTVNKEKCEFNKRSLVFFGFVFSRKGISPDPRKVKTNRQPQKYEV